MRGRITVLTVDYSPDDGVAMPDGKVDAFVESLIARVKASNEDTYVKVGCQIIIDCLRARIAYGALLGTRVELCQEGERIAWVDGDGRMVGGRVPVQSYSDAYLETLINARRDDV